MSPLSTPNSFYQSLDSRRLINKSFHNHCNETMNLKRDIQGISKMYASVLKSVGCQHTAKNTLELFILISFFIK